MSKGKSEKEKMLNSELYYAGDPELVQERIKCKELCYDYNNLRPSEGDKKDKLIRKIIGKADKNIYIEPPFFCDYGYNIKVGDSFYSNHNLVILDVCEVNIGHHCFIGPNVGIYTAGHPINVKQRCHEELEFGKKINIGNNVWIGGNTCILPGVNIGNNVTIGAGSVVTKDIPSNVTAFGNPCKVYRVDEENVGVE